MVNTFKHLTHPLPHVATSRIIQKNLRFRDDKLKITIPSVEIAGMNILLPFLQAYPNIGEAITKFADKIVACCRLI